MPFEQRVALVLAQPALQVEVVELLAPHHSGERLPVYPALVVAERLWRDPLVELVGVGDPGLEHTLEAVEPFPCRRACQAQADRL